MDPAALLEQAEDRHLSCGPSAAFALTRAAKVALVGLDLAAEEGGLPGQVLDDQLAQLVVEQGRRIAVHADQFRGRSRRNAGDELDHQWPLNTGGQPAPPANRIHLDIHSFSQLSTSAL